MRNNTGRNMHPAFGKPQAEIWSVSIQTIERSDFFRTSFPEALFRTDFNNHTLVQGVHSSLIAEGAAILRAEPPHLRPGALDKPKEKEKGKEKNPAEHSAL